MDWKIVKWKRVIWVGGALLLLILLLPLVKCNPDKPEPTAIEKESKEVKEAEQRRQIAEANSQALTKQLIECSALNARLLQKDLETIDKETNDRETAIINEPIPNDKLIEQMSDFAKKHRVN